MTLSQLMTILIILLRSAGTVGAQQLSAVNSAQATAFIGTWVFDMTSPEEVRGTRQTVKIWQKDGAIAASFQVGRFPPNEITGILQDGELLVLTASVRENGQPIWVVISLKMESETMMLAQMMERSQTIKRGIGKKQAN